MRKATLLFMDRLRKEIKEEGLTVEALKALRKWGREQEKAFQKRIKQLKEGGVV